MEWQPIETAPLARLEDDCEVILVAGEGKVAVAEIDGPWADDKYFFNDATGYENEMHGKPELRFKPSHWMPLPKPPAA